MPTRTRERTLRSVSGGRSQTIDPSGATFGGPNLGTSGVTADEYCADTTMNPPFDEDHPLLIRLRRANPTKISGTTPFLPGVLTGYTTKWDAFTISTRTVTGSCPPTSTLNDAYWMTKALANINPSRPLVDLPLFVFELREFPHMLKELGDLLKKGVKAVRPVDVPKAHLAVAFGWVPLVNDLISLAKLAKEIEKRKAYFRLLEKGTRLKRTLFKGEIQRLHTPGVINLTSAGSTVLQADTLLTEHLKVWFAINAKIVATLPDADHRPEYTYAQALGLQASAETLWNAFPWTWLIDYFLNIGDFLAANRGYIPWKATRLNIMAKQVALSTLTGLKPHPGITLSGGHSLETVTKKRAVYVNPIPILAWDPFLSGSQLAILGSLLTVKSLRETTIAR